MKSDFDFITYIKKQDKKVVIFIVVILVLLFALLFFGEGGNGENPASDNAEARLEELCSGIEDVGQCRVMVTYKNGEVFAVAVICEGAEDPVVKQRICDLISSIYGIGYNRVTVQPMAK